MQTAKEQHQWRLTNSRLPSPAVDSRRLWKFALEHTGVTNGDASHTDGWPIRELSFAD